LPEVSAADGTFQYEVTITNGGDSNILIPWSGDSLWEEGVALEELFGAGISLRISNGSGPDMLLEGGAVRVFGQIASPSSVYSLAPGQSVRIRATGRWAAGGVSLRDFLAGSNGVARISAVYRLHRGTAVGESATSPHRNVTLQWPQ